MTGSEPSAEEGGSGDELELETEEEVGTSAASTSAVGSGAVETTETESTSSTSPPTSTTATPQPLGTVNWWRLYRFPAQRPGAGSPFPAVSTSTSSTPGIRGVVEHEHEHGTAATSAYVAASTGYYPPEHGILNGADGAFVNFFSLLSRIPLIICPTRTLANPTHLQRTPRALGYATASKTDIARAGLKVLCRDALPAAEKDGRVVENCMERCLICLDDYAEEDDIRVLSCRHAFHLSCVDR
ncbi:hypothetical protein B0H13DRAFT_1871906 [Mycena leptocephala]|nr:hypothetical protein B0H13DRAFT_1871906 [Mycena leptocephala]